MTKKISWRNMAWVTTLAQMFSSMSTWCSEHPSSFSHGTAHPVPLSCQHTSSSLFMLGQPQHWRSKMAQASTWVYTDKDAELIIWQLNAEMTYKSLTIFSASDLSGIFNHIIQRLTECLHTPLHCPFRLHTVTFRLIFNFPPLILFKFSRCSNVPVLVSR